MSESCFRDFPKVPVPGNITAAEYGAQLISIPSDPEDPLDGDRFCDKLASYRKINAQNLKPTFEHKIQPLRTSTVPQSIIVRRDEGVVKGMWDALRDSGWRGLEQYLKRVERNPAVNLLHTCLSALASMTDAMFKLRKDAMVRAFPHLGLDAETVIRNAAQVRNWNKAWLKAVEWHPNFPKLAFALRDDTIRICEMGQEVMPLLRCPEQKMVSAISWRPHVDVQIAVGCEGGIVVWDLDTTNVVKAGASRSKYLTMKNHAPVTSVEYSHSGLLLMSCSSFDTSIYIWDVSCWTVTALQRVGGGGVPLVSWSPIDEMILATSPTTVFRIWEKSNDWIPKRWCTPVFPIESACWTPDGTTLLFASGEVIYAVHFIVNAVEEFINEKKSIAVPVYDIADSVVSSEDDELQYKVGGRVRKMDIDPNGSRLAVCFDDSELIAVFRIQPRSLCYLAPCGFIRGFPDEYPLTLTFQKDFIDGALLTIAWNSGRLQYFPFLFAGSEAGKNLLHQDYYKLPPAYTSTPKPNKGKGQRKTAGHQSSFGAGDGPEEGESSLYPDLSSSQEDEDVIIPSAPFRASSFMEPPKAGDLPDLDVIASPTSLTQPPRLFSLNHRSPQY